MSNQTLTKSTMNFGLVVALPSTGFRPAEPMRASSRDYGFDFDQEQLGTELLALLHAGHMSQASSVMSAEALETDNLFLY